MGQSNYSFPRTTNCIFISNIAYYGGAMRSTDESSPIVINCILWGNTADIEPQVAGPVTITYSDVQGGWAGCVDAGDNAAPDLPEEDLDGNPRIMDGDENGSALVDIGAYELLGALPDKEPPAPEPGLSVQPDGVTQNQITLISTEAFDPSGVTDTLLDPETSYAYRLKARDGFLNETGWSPTLWVETLSEPTVTDGLLAYWPMEDGQGQTVSDLSGNGNHGTFSAGTLPTWIPGKVGGALEFRGLDSYVTEITEPSAPARCPPGSRVR